MHWFYVNDSQICDGCIEISGEKVNHIKNVLRMKIGEKIILCNQEGTDYLCEIRVIKEGYVKAEILSAGDSESELPVKITLFQGLPKKDKMELIIQKAVELGVHEIVPVTMKRCVVRIEDSKKEEKKLARWQSVADSAAEQSKRGIIPKVHSVISYKEAVKYAKENISYNLFPYELAEGMEASRQCIKEAAAKTSIGIFIGPEGGFDDEEVNLAKDNGFHVISLGKRILRTETAGLALLSVLMFEVETCFSQITAD